MSNISQYFHFRTVLTPVTFQMEHMDMFRASKPLLAPSQYLRTEIRVKFLGIHRYSKGIPVVLDTRVFLFQIPKTMISSPVNMWLGSQMDSECAFRL